MNAVEFVKKHGWEEAKKFLNLPSYTIDQLLMLQSGLRCNELQKLVDSWELVESWGGLEDAKLYDLSPCEKKPESAGYKLKKAITDVERVGGGV
ncbi:MULTISPECIES: hypothetical protein [Acinetobacter]|uniref:Uncharacterized protein n=1 Tax=Acinetobacter guillouiae NIPH 991 TaxID=1217656 RepID=N8YBR0_ACIGI|nr:MULTISPECIES: hypothetical protein [Acinetobacter]ENV18764.1 hypothetical protein F964_00564 [Acinetobacter guillouiae NIPH 991]MCG7222001.1 hypothetical protein [Acinetobacter sp. AG3]